MVYFICKMDYYKNMDKETNMTPFEFITTQSDLSHDIIPIIDQFDIQYDTSNKLFLISNDKLDSFKSLIDSLTDTNFSINFLN